MGIQQARALESEKKWSGALTIMFSLFTVVAGTFLIIGSAGTLSLALCTLVALGWAISSGRQYRRASRDLSAAIANR